MSEPRAEQIADRVRQILAAIVGDAGANYWYTPKAIRFAGLTSACLDPNKGTVYVVSPDIRERTGVTNKEVEPVMTLDLSLATKHVPPQAETPFGAGASDRAIKVHRMQADVEKALTSGDGTLGLSESCGVWKTEITYWDETPERTFVDGWAVAYGRLQVTYRHVRSQP